MAKKRYYLLDTDGVPLAVYARNQPHIEDLVKLDEAPDENYRWDGSAWVVNIDRLKSDLSEVDTLISSNIHKFSRRLDFNAILAIYDNYKAAVEAATTVEDLNAAKETLMDDLYSE